MLIFMSSNGVPPRLTLSDTVFLNAPEIYERLLGVVLNKVDMTTIGRYERHRSNYYYKNIALVMAI